MESIFFIMVTLATTSIITTLVVFVNTRFLSEGRSKYDLMLVSSVFLSITLVLMIFDLRIMEQGKDHNLITFIEYMTLSFTAMMINKSILSLYNIREILKNYVPVVASVLMAIIATVSTIFGSYAIREFVYIYIVLSTFGYLIYHLKTNNILMRKNIFFYQSLVFIVLGVLDILRIIFVGTEPLYDTSPYEFLVTALGIILFLSIQTSYLAEMHRVIAEDTHAENIYLNNTVTIVKKLSELDPLTNILNRRKLDDILLVLSNQSLEDNTFSIVMCDVNNLKYINDTFGHQTGDIVLQHVAKTLSENIRKTDSIGRYGGDEFMLILQDLDHKNAIQLIDSLQQKMTKLICDAIKQPVYVSMGASTYSGSLSLHELIYTADINMYKNKTEMKKNRTILPTSK